MDMLPGMRLKDIDTEDFIKLLLMGDSGTGKSTLLAGAGEAMIYAPENGMAADQYKSLADEITRIIFSDNFDDFIELLDFLLYKPHPFKLLGLDSSTVFYLNLVEFFERKLKGKIGMNKHYQLANSAMRSIVNKIDKIRMHVVFTSHLKDEFSKEKDTFECIGQTFDGYKKSHYYFNLVAEAKRLPGGEHVAIIKRSRTDGFKVGDVFPLHFKEFMARFRMGKSIKQAGPIELPKARELDDFHELCKLINVPESKKEYWLEKTKSLSFDLMPRENLLQIVSMLSKKAVEIKMLEEETFKKLVPNHESLEQELIDKEKPKKKTSKKDMEVINPSLLNGTASVDQSQTQGD